MPAGSGSSSALKNNGEAPLKVRSKDGKPDVPVGFIEIKPSTRSLPGTAANQGKKVSPEQYWLDYYKTHDEKPELLREKIGRLNAYKKFRDVRAILVGYLTYRNRNPEPWIYEALALAIKLNNGGDAEVKQALGYAADQAVKSRNPNHLVSVADQMVLLGYNDRVGSLLDQAAEMVPHRAEPLVMSINLARKTKDPKRMGDSVDKLLSLGWPGVDETLRREARREVENLAKELKEETRGAEADALLERLPASEARDLFIRLTWVGDADLDLAIDEPLGATARYSTPRTVFGGSIVKNGYGTHPEEVYVCPRGFDGEYVVNVSVVTNNPEKPALQASLEIITHEGTPNEHKEAHTITLGPKPPAPVKVTLKDGRRTQALPYLAPSSLAPLLKPSADKQAKPEKPAAKPQEKK